jgi:hypothetical protein
MAEYASGTGPGNVGSFSIAVGNFVTRSRQRWEIVVKRVIQDIFSQLILVTPVDTGFARSNWGFGPTIPHELLPNPAQHLPWPRGASGIRFADREAQGQAAIRSTPVVEGVVGYIYNNTRYIIPLEYGHSPQAPPPLGIVRLTLTRFQNYVAAAATKG